MFHGRRQMCRLTKLRLVRQEEPGRQNRNVVEIDAWWATRANDGRVVVLGAAEDIDVVLIDHAAKSCPPFPSCVSRHRLPVDAVAAAPNVIEKVGHWNEWRAIRVRIWLYVEILPPQNEHPPILRNSFKIGPAAQ